MPVCVLFVSSTSNIGFKPECKCNHSHNQSAKDIDQYFKTELNAEDSLPPKSELILPNGLCKFGERAHDRNLIYTVGGIWTKSSYQYAEFSVRPENTHSYVLKLTKCICHSNWMLCLYNYQIYVYGMDFSVSSKNFMISMRSFFIYENHHTSI